MTDKLWQVMAGEGKRARAVFEGQEKDARAYLERHFPRAHIEPGNGTQDVVPDAVLVAPDGGNHSFHAENGWVDHSEAPAGDHAADPDDEPA